MALRAGPRDRAFQGLGAGASTSFTSPLETFAHSAFIAAHCFSNGGAAHGCRTTRRASIFKPRLGFVRRMSTVRCFLTTTFQIRRPVIRLSRAPREVPNILSAEVTTTFDDVLPSIPAITTFRLVTSSTIQRRSIRRERCWRRSGESRSSSNIATLVNEPRRARSHHRRKSAPLQPFVLRTRSGCSTARRAVHWPKSKFTIRSSDSSAYTAADGRVGLGFMPDSGGLLVLRKIGYGIRAIRVRGATADTTPISER